MNLFIHRFAYLLIIAAVIPAAFSDDVWAIRNPNSITIPAHAGKDVGIILFPLTQDRLNLPDQTVILKVNGTGLRSKEIPLSYEFVPPEKELVFDFVAKKDEFGLSDQDLKNVIAFANKHSVKLMVGHVYPEVYAAKLPEITIGSINGNPLSEVGDLVIYVGETIEKEDMFTIRRLHKVVLKKP